jgi:hypothetical protein
MYVRARAHLPAVAVAAVALLVIGSLGLSSFTWTDYDSEARPAFDALLAGHVVRFLQLAPAYGGSLVIRAPFAFVPKLWSGGELATFRAVAAPCLLASGGLGVWLWARMGALGRSPLARLLALLLCVANPITVTALKYGHPEELLGGTLCVAAVLVAGRGRPLWAGILLGLAIANKQWALLAVGPMLIALPDRRPRALLTAGVVAAVVMAPLMLAGGAFTTQATSAAQTGSLFNPWQLWWFLGSHSHAVVGVTGALRPGYRVAPAWIAGVAHPLIIAVMVPLTALYFRLRSRHRRRALDGVLLLALLLLLRCALDPWDNSYYPLPFLLALVGWETLARERPPVLALGASLAAWLVLQDAASAGLSPDAQALLFLVVTVPALIALSLVLFAPQTAATLRAAVRGVGRRRPIAEVASVAP